MKIHLQTKRGLNTLKFGGYSEILTLFLRGNWKSGYNVSIILLEQSSEPSSEPRAEPKHSGALSEASMRVAERSETPRSAVSSKFGMV